jgi:hypothetical protein
VLRLVGRYWLIDSVEETTTPARAFAKPARYRLQLSHPDGRVEAGAFRRYREDAPQLGHTLTTLDDGQPVSWEVLDVHLARDEQGEPYLELVAERDYAEAEELPDHELEHTLARRAADLPEDADALFFRVESAGLSLELVALEPGEAPDWDEAGRYLDALTLDEVEDDLLELAGVNPGSDAPKTWLDQVKGRLRVDLERFRGDVEGDHDQIEEWEFRDGRIFAAVGGDDDEGDPDSGYGWLCRLVDAGALAAAGFRRVRKADLQVSE